ncbi:oxidoreductase [Paenibacillus sp. MY03]|uniref:Gfo/Idh/MocA family protein n=1 Tax=Paenibacillus TaxID=44249 RepID=UPI000B3C6B5D|nr:MULTISPECIES: Gfo/Idh/MocA family oxidoreductase [Paenibacillus]OUS69957.1 oxidoreductase [Paenibacillus sp. MY03]
MKLKFALIGCGRISPNHIAAALENNIEIVALCDIRPEKMKRIISDFNLTESLPQYTDYKELLRNSAVDLIAICTESGSHGQIAIDCIEAGCHLIIEKPIALSLEEADEIIELAKKKNIKVSACHQNRFNKSIKKIREAVQENRFGKLLHGTAHVRWHRGEDYYKQAPWRGTWEQDGGALMNQCIHNIDLLRWMMGDEIDEVIGMIDNVNHDIIEAEDLGLALIKFKNGSYGVVEGTTNIYPSNLEETLYIFGSKGTVKVGGKSVNIIEEWMFADMLDSPEKVKKEYQENPPNVYGFGHIPLYHDVIDAIKGDRDPYVSAEDGRKALELVLAIYKSAAEGTRVKLPLTNANTSDFKGMFK